MRQADDITVVVGKVDELSSAPSPARSGERARWRRRPRLGILTAVGTPPLTRFAWLSIAAAVATIALKTIAYLLTGSSGLLSDAVESLVNLAGAIMALSMLTIAARPADEEHSFGHSKAEYFSSGVEGTLILVAALAIGIAAVPRLLAPRPIEQVGVALAVSVGASVVNPAVALVLLRVGKRRRSITLETNARHLLTDVWTSAGVIVGVGAVVATDYLRLDPIVALLVAGNIVWTGVRIVRRSVLGLMDTSLPAGELAAVREVLDSHLKDGIGYMRSGRGDSPGPGGLCRSTCWCPARGPCTGDTNCSRTSKPGFARPCRTSRCSRTLNRSTNPASWENLPPGQDRSSSQQLRVAGIRPANACRRSQHIANSRHTRGGPCRLRLQGIAPKPREVGRLQGFPACSDLRWAIALAFGWAAPAQQSGRTETSRAA